MNTTKGILIAGAAAALVLSGAIDARADEKKTGGEIYCTGINACKGSGACSGADHGCAGQNACKGQGVVKATSEKDCTEKGGKIVPDPHAPK